MNNEVIIVKDVHKKFKVFFDKSASLKEKILFRNRNRYEERWVLRGISLSVKRGETIGLIGENGCGKSTLLKLLSKIMYPDTGNIEMVGRVSSLIELGAGFHPDMSGRENIYINAAIFGLSKIEIDKRVDRIIDFSELKEFVDNPVRTYSSGMYMRLAFSVAINVDADILLIDEILAVGDANFQSKCFEKLRELKALGMTIVIVTHDTGTIEKFCNKAIWLNNGLVVSQGAAVKVVDDYLKYMNEKRYENILAHEKEVKEIDRVLDNKEVEQVEEKYKQNVDSSSMSDIDIQEQENCKIDYNANRFGLKYIEIIKAEIFDYEGEETTTIWAERPVDIKIMYKVNRKIDGYVFGYSFSTIDGVLINGSNTQLDRTSILTVEDSGSIILHFDSLPFQSGKYILQLAVVDENGTPMDFYRDYAHFDVVSKDRCVGLVSLKHSWKFE